VSTASRAGLDTRRLALDVLLEVETHGAFADAALGRGLSERASWPAKDRAFATRLVYGSIAWQRRLDWIADHWARPRSERLDPEVRLCLRLGLFQLFFSDRIPSFAAVDTSVELAKSRRPAAARLVNAVLRRAIRERPPSPPEGRTAEELGIRWSHPDWIVRRWIAERGVEDTARLLAANNEAAPLALRMPGDGVERERAKDRLAARGIVGRPGRFSPSAWIVDGGGFPEPDDGVVAQGEASQLVVHLLADHARAGQVLDACAAPGGKSSALAEIADRDGVVTAIDLHRPGLLRARELCEQAGIRSPLLARADARRPPFRGAVFDAALVDAPCSGVGTLRSHPEIRWRLRPGDLEDLTARQRAILDAVEPLVRPGGALVYATCSLFRAENEDVVAAFLSSHSEWRAVDSAPHLPEPARDLARDGALRTWPHEHGLDGFFAVRLERAIG
jgi:16S rRNA (cytosine967-C5)-methyltransferase